MSAEIIFVLHLKIMGVDYYFSDKRRSLTDITGNTVFVEYGLGTIENTALPASGFLDANKTISYDNPSVEITSDVLWNLPYLIGSSELFYMLDGDNWNNRKTISGPCTIKEPQWGKQGDPISFSLERITSDELIKTLCLWRLGLPETSLAVNSGLGTSEIGYFGKYSRHICQTSFCIHHKLVFLLP